MKDIWIMRVLLSIAIFFLLWSMFLFTKAECRKAYKNGYYAGWWTAKRMNDESTVCTLGFVYNREKEGEKSKYVGVGNEVYCEGLEKLTKRGKKYWWAKSLNS